eukprot:gene19385-22885_t
MTTSVQGKGVTVASASRFSRIGEVCCGLSSSACSDSVQDAPGYSLPTGATGWKTGAHRGIVGGASCKRVWVMTLRRVWMSALCGVSLIATSACVTDPNTGHRKVSRTAIGATAGVVGGLVIGGLLGGGTGRILGAGIGGLAGASVGYTMDKQIKELKEQTAGSG